MQFLVGESQLLKMPRSAMIPSQIKGVSKRREKQIGLNESDKNVAVHSESFEIFGCGDNMPKREPETGGIRGPLAAQPLQGLPSKVVEEATSETGKSKVEHFEFDDFFNLTDNDFEWPSF